MDAVNLYLKKTGYKNKIMRLYIDRFTVVTLCLTIITGIAINKFEIVSTLISWMM